MVKDRAQDTGDTFGLNASAASGKSGGFLALDS
jgi:hypothetical protein